MVDSELGAVPRILARLEASNSQEQAVDVRQVQECLRDVLPRFDWGCRPPGPEGHAAMTFAFPRSLLSRFAPMTGEAEVSP